MLDWSSSENNIFYNNKYFSLPRKIFDIFLDDTLKTAVIVLPCLYHEAILYNGKLKRMYLWF
jgi:hypothetical protein